MTEAQRETKKAHVKLAEAAVKLAEVNLAQIEKAVAANAGGGKIELEKARLEIDAAKARLEIQIGEMKELEIRAKFAKRRLEEIKAERAPPAENPFRKVDRRVVDPVPPPPAP